MAQRPSLQYVQLSSHDLIPLPSILSVCSLDCRQSNSHYGKTEEIWREGAFKQDQGRMVFTPGKEHLMVRSAG
jgi:hypothetical protein